MKKPMAFAVVVLVTLTAAFLMAQTGPNPAATTKITLVKPTNNHILKNVPVQINFKWRPVEGITQYSLLIQVKEGAGWKNHISLRNLTGDNVTVTYDQAKDFRWLVGSMGTRRQGYSGSQVYKSLMWKVLYQGESSSNDSAHRNM